jgi:hypothetical protein
MGEKLLDIISTWDHFGQGLFLILVLCILLASVNFIVKMFVVLLRGWPPKYGSEEKEEAVEK